MFHEYRYTFDEVRPSMQTLKSCLQLPPDSTDYPLVEDVVKKVFAAMEDTAEITGGYRIMECTAVDAQEGIVNCAGNLLVPGRKISRYMQGAEQVALFICTAGERFTTLSHAYQQNGDFLEAFIVESIGSATVENAMDNIQRALEADMQKEGEKITNRYSPGYCDWKLSGQQALFRAIGTHPTGITLTESCLMQPIKSVSGIIGIGKEVKKRPYGCAICNSKTCTYRKIMNPQI